MRIWHATVCILIWSLPTPATNFRTLEMNLIPSKLAPTPKAVTPKSIAKVIPNSITEFFGQLREKLARVGTTAVSVKMVDDDQTVKNRTRVKTPRKPYLEDPKPPDLPPTVKQADLPQDIQVSILPHNTGQELQFNVSWVPPKGIVTGYDLEAKSLTGTTDCLDDSKKPLQCYNTDILGNSTWSLIPVELSSIAGSCELRPGCTYRLALKTTLRDGSNTAYFDKEIQECEAGKCSCAYWNRLPVPTVSAKAVTISNKLFIHITWSLPKPQFPQRLPSGLKKHSYVVGVQVAALDTLSNLSSAVSFPLLRKQHKVSEILKSKWYGHYVVEPQTFEANGLVADGDSEHSVYFPFNNTNVEMSAEVFLKDERGCYGPLGSHKIAADSEDSVRELSIGAYAILLGLFVSAWTMGAVFVLGTRVVKRVLKSLRPASVSAPLEPITRHPAWLPLQRRS